MHIDKYVHCTYNIHMQQQNTDKFSQVKSKQRVAAHGEVFTAEREVKAMCDLVAQECDRIDSRFLEPACGNGNFLAEIANRKLSTVRKLYKSNTYDFERYSVPAISSLYGVDILADNVAECRARLYGIWFAAYKSICKKSRKLCFPQCLYRRLSETVTKSVLSKQSHTRQGKTFSVCW